METNFHSPNEREANSTVSTAEVKNLSLPAHITILNLSHRNLTSLDNTVKFPPNLVDLDLTHNSLTEIPNGVLELANLKRLDISYNNIQHFNTTPQFLHSLEHLNISNNKLADLPYWVWAETPKSLTHLDISCNSKIRNSLTDDYFEELLQYKTSLKEVILFNCKLGQHLELLGTFVKAKVLEIGTCDLTRYNSNVLDHIPCKGLDRCRDIQRLNLSNTQLYSIESNIDIYKHLIEIDLSQNNLNSLPNEFCNLVNLQTCILSVNTLLYLPDDITKLQKLKHLHLDSNHLCMLPESLGELKDLTLLDLYENYLHEVPKEVENIAKLDLGQNYLEEPQTEEYFERKRRLRLNIGHTRHDGRKVQPEESETVYSSDTTDDEELIEYINNLSTDVPTGPVIVTKEEDWDSDEYWEPTSAWSSMSPSAHPTWIHMVQQKMAEGNFCPIDNHVPSVDEIVRRERFLNPKVWKEVEGQFDHSDEDS